MIRNDFSSRLYLLRENTQSQMMSFVLETKAGQFFVIDGGCRGDAPYLMQFLQKLQGDCPVVDGWFLTHAHSDHIDAFMEIMKTDNKKITINKIYYNFPDQEFIIENEEEADDIHTILEFNALEPEFKDKAVIAKEGDRFDFPGVSFEVLYAQDASFRHNAINNSSLVLRLNIEGRKIVFLADLGVEGGRKLLQTHGAMLKADAVQMAHHGQNGVERDVYEAIRPDLCIWCTPQWLWDNNQGNGVGTGPWETLEVRSWMQEIGVAEHLVTKDGTGCVCIDANGLTVLRD